jgi:hypothetical protein
MTAYRDDTALMFEVRREEYDPATLQRARRTALASSNGFRDASGVVKPYA